jgi:hypothetical protein
MEGAKDRQAEGRNEGGEKAMKTMALWPVSHLSLYLNRSTTASTAWAICTDSQSSKVVSL